MKEEVLHNRVSRFLYENYPFCYLSEAECVEIANKSKLKFLDKGEILFTENAELLPDFFLIQQGQIELFYHENGKEVLVEICEKGDLFGIKAHIGKRRYINTSRAKEETLLIAIPYNVFESYIQKESRIALYFAAGFSSGTNKQISMKQISLARQSLENASSKLSVSSDFIKVHKDREIIYCNPTTTIYDAAKIMTSRKVGSILVLDYEDRPIGIVTDVDFRKKVVLNRVPLDSPISTIMSSPVLTQGKDITFSQALITMMQKNIRHICITEDGTPNSRVEGIVTEHDILLIEGNAPAVLTKEILQSDTVEKIAGLRNKVENLIKQYLQQDVSLYFLFELVTSINDVVIQKLIQLKQAELEKEGFAKPSIDFAWISLGSEGRKEQIFRTDQDNAIIYDDPPSEKAEEYKNYFQELGKRVCDALHICGFEYCKGDIMAKNPKWTASLSTWKEYFSTWLNSLNPNAILHFSIFFDFRLVYGKEELVDSLTELVEKGLSSNPNFLRFLAINAISSKPPLGLFGGFLVERQGEHKDHLDIKLRGTAPLVDAARVLALEAKIQEKNTFERWKKLGELYLERKNEYEEYTITFEILSKIRFRNYIEHPESGNFINPKTLSKIEKETLKNAFQIIKDLQEKLEVHFQLDLIPK